MGSRARYILSRSILSAFMVLLLLTVVFVVLRVVPGDPATALLPPKTPESAVIKFRHDLGLDKPILVQYAEYLYNVFSGRWGKSIALGEPISTIILRNLPTTIELTVGGTLISVLLGILGGLLAAMKKDTAIDQTISIATVLAFAIPGFWLALLLQVVFSVDLRLLPSGGRVDVLLAPTKITGFMILDSILTLNAPALLSSVTHLMLPCLTIGVFSAALLARVTRAETIGQIGKEYVLCLRAKGLREQVIFRKHALRNALLPVVTIIGLQMATLLGGAVITETIFNLPGIGRLLITSFLQRDYPLTQGILVVDGLLVAMITLTTDIMYKFIDPRVKY